MAYTTHEDRDINRLESILYEVAFTKFTALLADQFWSRIFFKILFTFLSEKSNTPLWLNPTPGHYDLYKRTCKSAEPKDAFTYISTFLAKWLL